MFSSKKILYFIIISLLLVCYANGIDYRSNAYAEYVTGGGTEIVDFSDSGFFAPADIGTEIAVVSLPDEGDSASDDNSNYSVDINNTTASPDGGETTADTGTTATANEETQPSEAEQTTAQTAPPTTTATTNNDAWNTTPPAGNTTTTVYTTTTTQPVYTTPPTTTTTTTKSYVDSGSMHFEYSAVTIYSGASTVISLSMPIGVQKLATFTSMDTSVATVRNYSDTSVEVTGVAIGTAWIQAVNVEKNYVAYCKITVTDFAGEVVRLVNIERSNYGLPPLINTSDDPQIASELAVVQRMANIRLSEEMQSFSHTRPNGQKFSTVAGEIGLQYRKIGENLAMGQTTPQQAVSDWMNSPSHRENILNSEYKAIRVAYGISKDQGGLPYWVQIFYTPLYGW